MAIDHYNHDLARTVAELFNSGLTDPSSEDIAKAYFGDKPVGGETIEGIRKRLRSVRKILIRDYHLDQTYLVSLQYYTVYQRNPGNYAEAWDCIPQGNRKSSAGICLAKVDDLILEATHKRNLDSTSVKWKKNADNVVEAIENGMMQTENGGFVLGSAGQKMMPEKLDTFNDSIAEANKAGRFNENARLPKLSERKGRRPPLRRRVLLVSAEKPQS